MTWGTHLAVFAAVVDSGSDKSTESEFFFL